MAEKKIEETEEKKPYVLHFPSGRTEEGERAELPPFLRRRLTPEEGSGGIDLRKGDVDENGVTHYHF